MKVKVVVVVVLEGGGLIFNMILRIAVHLCLCW